MCCKEWLRAFNLKEWTSETHWTHRGKDDAFFFPIIMCLVKWFSGCTAVVNKPVHVVQFNRKPKLFVFQTYELLPGGGLVALHTEQPFPRLRLLKFHSLPSSLPVPHAFHSTVCECLHISWIPDDNKKTLHFYMHLISTFISLKNKYQRGSKQELQQKCAAFYKELSTNSFLWDIPAIL